MSGPASVRRFLHVVNQSPRPQVVQVNNHTHEIPALAKWFIPLSPSLMGIPMDVRFGEDVRLSMVDVFIMLKVGQ